MQAGGRCKHESACRVWFQHLTALDQQDAGWVQMHSPITWLWTDPQDTANKAVLKASLLQSRCPDEKWSGPCTSAADLVQMTPFSHAMHEARKAYQRL